LAPDSHRRGIGSSGKVNRNWYCMQKGKEKKVGFDSEKEEEYPSCDKRGGIKEDGISEKTVRKRTKKETGCKGGVKKVMEMVQRKKKRKKSKLQTPEGGILGKPRLSWSRGARKSFEKPFELGKERTGGGGGWCE